MYELAPRAACHLPAALLIFVPLLAVPGGPAPATPTAPACAVRVGYSAPGCSGTGSGTVVACENGRCLVLTCRHVCPQGEGRSTVVAAGRSYPAEWVGENDRADLTALVIGAELPHCLLADAEPAAGTPLWQWGFPGGRLTPKHGTAGGYGGVAWRVNPGRWLPTGFRDWNNVLAAEPGDSGAGVFDTQGRLVAVCWGRGLYDARAQSCVGLSDVRRFLREAAGDRFPGLKERLEGKPPAGAGVGR